ncbi:MAG: hypothetical protein H7256_01495 [Bdellovibrio sp.]|nr:hypothetical protein [Bdellovibrio sp.]
MKTPALKLVSLIALLFMMSCQKPSQEKLAAVDNIDTWSDGLSVFYENGKLVKNEQVLNCRAAANGLTRRYFTLVKNDKQKMILRSHVVEINQDGRMTSYNDHVYLTTDVEITSENKNLTKVNLRLSHQSDFETNKFFPEDSDLVNLQENETAIEFTIDKTQIPAFVSATTSFSGLSAYSDITKLECRVMALNLK